LIDPFPLEGVLVMPMVWYNSRIMSLDEITTDTLIEDIVDERPDLVGMLAKLGVVCVKCSDPFWGTIGDYCRIKNMDIDEIIGKISAEMKKEG